MPTLRLRSDVILRKIEQRFGGSGAALAREVGVHPSTLSRWLRSAETNQFPRRPDRVMALAAAIEVDPLAIWDFDGASFPSFVHRLWDAARRRRWQRLLPALAFLDEYLMPTGDWPPSRNWSGDGWTCVDIEHEADRRRNTYEILLVSPAPDRGAKGIAADPQVWHVGAVATSTMARAFFEPLGFVSLSGDEIVLRALDGLVQRVRHRDRSFALQVFFGERSARYRVASLHGFTLRRVERVPAGMPLLRFCQRRATCLDPVAGGRARPCELRRICAGFRPPRRTL